MEAAWGGPKWPETIRLETATHLCTLSARTTPAAHLAESNQQAQGPALCLTEGRKEQREVFAVGILLLTCSAAAKPPLSIL